MSVYTAIEENVLVEFLRDYQVGTLTGFAGIGEGIENTNYFVDTTQGRYVLTLFEEMPAADLPAYLELMAHIAHHGVPCPDPIIDSKGVCLKELAGKPAVLINCLAGTTVERSNVAQCCEVGSGLAKLHAAGAGFEQGLADKRGFDWCLAQRAVLHGAIDPEDYELLDAELDYQAEQDLDPLPQGIIHADLFRDNVLFVGDQLGGIIDFYYAYRSALLYDLAITVNDWCRDEKQLLDQAKCDALLGAYAEQRAFDPLEKAAWAWVMRRAALRFWISRMVDTIAPRPGDIIHSKDPDVFKRILKDCRSSSLELPG